MSELASNIAVEISLNCQPLNEPTQQHRIWLTRDGEVLTPDHHEVSEEVVTALGGEVVNTCAYWRMVPVIMQKEQKDNNLILPNLSSWQFSNQSFWNKQLCWVALTGILGSPTYAQLDPEMALEHAKLYQKYGNDEAFPVLNELEYLQSPWKRTGGFRRHTAVEPQELEEMMQSGISMNRVSAALALDISPLQAKDIVATLKKFNLPSDIVIYLAYALPGERLTSFVHKLSQEQADALPSLLQAFSKIASTISDNEIEAFLLK